MGEKTDISPNGDSGILKEVLKEGQAGCQPYKGDRVSVHYVGVLEDGTPFDSSRDRGTQFQFTLGKGEVIKGWDVGVATMNKGELSRFTIKSEYGYGESGSPPKIPGGATLVFEVELFDFQGEDITKAKDKGIIKRTLVPGEGLDSPNDGGFVEIEIKGFHKDRVFDERKLNFISGEGLDQDLPLGVEMALEKMKKGETAKISLLPAYGFGAEGHESFGIPSNEHLDYEIKLVTFERAKESWQLDGEQKLDQSKIFKEKGTAYFKQGKFQMASKKYNKIVEFLEHEISLKDDKEIERKNLLQSGRLNLSMCYLRMSDWIEARNVCDKVLEENEDCEKAHFRKGEALIKLNDHEEARKCFSEALRIDQDNKAARTKLLLCQQAIKKQKAKEKKTYANMFDRFARIDNKKEEEAKKNQKPLEINEWSGKDKPNAASNGSNETLKVSGDIQMDLDLNKEIRNDQERMDE